MAGGKGLMGGSGLHPQDNNMNHFPTFAFVLAGAWCAFIPAAGGQVCPARQRPALKTSEWAMERVELLDGRRYEGLIESEDEVWVNLIQIRRPNGRPMYLVIRPIHRSSIAAVVRLGPQQQAELRRRIEKFINRSRIEAGRMEAIRLGLLTRNRTHYYRYRGKWFTLESTVDEPTTRRVIVRIEQVFTAYRQILAPRVESARPLRLVVLGSIGQYQAYLARLGLQIQNPACFLQEENLVVAGSRLARFAAAVAKVQARHDQLRAELEQLEKQLRARLQEISRQLQKEGTSRSEIAAILRMEKRKFAEVINRKRKELNRCDRENARIFRLLTHQMFARLYHEAFHAYLENYVYPHKTHDVPLWLDEGLAMVFEGGLLESDTLRLDAPNSTALKQLKADLAGGQPLPLGEVLAADRQAFLHTPTASRYYVYSWGLVYYLAFEKQLLVSPALDGYVRLSAKNTPPAQRFERLVGMPLAKFERAWRQYILKLR